MITPPTSTRVPARLIAGLAVGNLLNPLNSSMIAVALVSLTGDFDVPLGTVTWVVSAFYLGGMVGMPLMGQLADRYGARNILTAGLVLVAVTSGLAPLAPSLIALVGLRLLQAIGTSAPYPAALAVFRRRDPHGRAPAGALGAISITNSVSSALGPVVGGALVATAGWQGIFVANVPLVVLAIGLAMLWLPADSPRTDVQKAAHTWTWQPLTNVRLLLVYGQFAAVNVVFYAVFYGLPLWLEQTRHYPPGLTGVLLLPVAGVGVLATPAAARIVTKAGAKLCVLIGAITLLAGSLLLLTFDSETPVAVLLAVGAVLGVPNGFNNLGLQAALYEAAAANQIGAAAGFLQTCRYAGAIVSTAIIGAVMGAQASNASLHVLALVMGVTSAGLVVASAVAYRPSSAR